MAQPHSSEGATEYLAEVSFSFMTDDEVQKHSVVKVTSPIMLDAVDAPVPGGMYDPRMGPLGESTRCKTCAQPKNTCNGHYGHLDLILVAYNPLLFNTLYQILQRTCFHCFKFRASREQVETCVASLNLIAKGDVAGVKMLDSASSSASSRPAESYVSDISHSTTQSGRQVGDTENSRHHGWTSLQFIEAMSTLDTFFKKKLGQCARTARIRTLKSRNQLNREDTFEVF